jgi:creatinine amidohydrolase
MAGQIYNIEKLTYPQIDKLDRDKTYFFIACSPLEEHGPHLPIGVDAFNAMFFAKQTAEILTQNNPDFDAVLFPVLPLGTQVYKQLGSFYVKASTLNDVIYYTGKGLALYGFKHIFVFTAHGTPKQVVAIERGCRKVNRKHGSNMLCLSGAIVFKFLKGEIYEAISKKLNREFTAEEREILKYDYHAGWWETAMMLKFYPELVDNVYKDLKPYLKNHLTKQVISENKVWQGYTGAPAKADLQFAEASIDVFAELAGDLISRHMKGEDITKDVQSPFYSVPILHPRFKKYVAIGIISIVILILLILLFLQR